MVLPCGLTDGSASAEGDVGVGGLWIGDASRFPVFSARARRRIAFGPESTHRPGGIDDAWHKSADAAGVVILDTEAVDRDGKRGWIVVPAPSAASPKTSLSRRP